MGGPPLTIIAAASAAGGVVTFLVIGVLLYRYLKSQQRQHAEDILKQKRKVSLLLEQHGHALADDSFNAGGKLIFQLNSDITNTRFSNEGICVNRTSTTSIGCFRRHW